MLIITVKLPRNKDHDPANKQTGECPVSPACTDVTGQHHSFLDRSGQSAEEARKRLEDEGLHVTRIEEVREESPALCPEKVWPYTENNICTKDKGHRMPHIDRKGRRFDHSGYL